MRSVTDNLDASARFYRLAIVPCAPLRLGSWSQTIKVSTTDNLWHDDMTNYVQALQETGQNFCIYSANDEIDMEDLITLLETLEDEGSDIQVFAAVGAPHLGARTTVWHTNFVPANCDCDNAGDFAAIYDCEQDCLSSWFHAWTNAATELSELSLTHSNLKGYVINDFDGYVESADRPACVYGKRLTRDQVIVITEGLIAGILILNFGPRVTSVTLVE